MAEESISGLARQELRDVVTALKTNVRAINGLDRSLATMTAKVASQINPIVTLTDAFRRQEKISLQALSIGTTYNQFLAANTESIKGLKSSNVDLMEIMVSAFAQGLRRMSRDTLELADEMNLTGQNTESLIKAMATMRFLTGNSIDATSNLAKTIRTTQEATGVSFEKLAQSVTNLQTELFNISLFGPQAVEGLSKIGTTLTGSLASVPGSQRAIAILLKTLEPLNIAQQSLLGIKGFAEKALNNDLSEAQINQEILNASKNLQSMLGQDNLTRQVLSEKIGSAQVNSILKLGSMIQNQMNLTDAERGEQSKQLETMREFEIAKTKFFTDLAPEIHSTIVRFLPLIVGVPAAFEATKAGAQLMGSAKADRAASKGLRGILKGIGGLGLLAGGPIGIIAGLGMTFGPSLLDAIKGGSDPEKKAAALAEEEARERRKLPQSRDMNDYSTLVNIVSEVNRQALQRADSQQLTRAIEMLTQKIEELKPTQQNNAPSPQTKN